jgi:hypothetical protein
LAQDQTLGSGSGGIDSLSHSCADVEGCVELTAEHKVVQGHGVGKLDLHARAHV